MHNAACSRPGGWRGIFSPGAIVLTLAAAFSPGTAPAFSITDVSVLPADTPRPFDDVMLQIDVFSPNLDPFLVFPTEVSVQDNQILVDLFMDSSLLTVPDSLTEIVSVGALAPGNYDYTVSVFFASGLPLILADQMQGSFTVIPLPPALWLMAASLAALGAAGRRARCRP